MTKDFLKEILAVPNPSGHEEFLVECVEDWCRQNGIKTKKDGHGNLFLTKGHAAQGQYFPAMTAHLDSVVRGAEALVRERKLMDIEDDNGKLTASIDGRACVIGGDDKNAVAICLSVLKRLKAGKAAFYVGEEVGCQGSRNSDFGFFDDCAFVVGMDSPELNRAAKSCSGLMLFDDDFFEKWFGPICKKHGLTDFRHEPGTDIMFIREKTKLQTINFGNGGYKCHSVDEYVVYDDVCKAEELTYALCTEIPTDRRWVSKELKREVPDWMRRPPPGRWSAPPGSGKWVNGKPVAVQPEFDFGGPKKKGGKKEKDVSIAVQFDIPGIADDFVQEIAERGIPVELDDDGLEIIITGRRKDVQEAYAIWARYDSEDDSIAGWKDLDKPYVDGFEADVMEDPVASFSGDDEPVNVEPIDVDSAPDPDDPSYDELAGDPDAEDFWSWFESRR